MRASAAPSAPAWQQRWERAVDALGLPVFTHAQRRRARRDEAARGDAAGHAVRARRNAGISHNPLESTTSDDADSACGLLPPARPTGRRTVMTAEKLDAWIDAHFDEQVRFLQALVQVPTDTPPGNNAPHAERTAELLKALASRPRSFPVPAEQVKAAGLQSITNLIVRRHGGAAAPWPQRPWRRGAARRRLDAPPYGGEIARRQGSTAAPPP